ncbi:hypothetical protein BC628DRAFT_1420056 [Trametes gibbosa]|nr:hypothetical protein BC628DRAFT_1420056 [Trametes gibbosa]
MHLRNLLLLALFSVRPVVGFSTVVGTTDPGTPYTAVENNGVPIRKHMRRDLSDDVTASPLHVEDNKPSYVSSEPAQALRDPRLTAAVETFDPPSKQRLSRTRAYDSHYHRGQASDSQPSSTSCMPKGHIRVTDMATGNPIGFVSGDLTFSGSHELTERLDHALTVIILRDCDATEDTPFEIETVRGPEGEPLLGGAFGGYYPDGPADLQNDTFSNVYLINIDHSVPFGPAQYPADEFPPKHRPRQVESFVWTSSPAAADGTLPLTMSWVNTDGRMAQNTQLVYVPGVTFILLCDFDQWQDPLNNVQIVAFTFVPDTSSTL